MTTSMHDMTHHSGRMYNFKRKLRIACSCSICLAFHTHNTEVLATMPPALHTSKTFLNVMSIIDH